MFHFVLDHYSQINLVDVLYLFLVYVYYHYMNIV